MEQQRVTIRDIAEELGVSTATVSNVIHGKTSRVSDETIRRVEALLEKRQYIPSMAGILLARNSSKIIGVFVNDHEKYEGHTLDDFFIASALNELSTQIESRGQFMMVKKAHRPEDILQFSSMWNMDGVVMMGFCRQDYVYLRQHMRIPFVIYDGFYEATEGLVNITIDNLDGGRQVGECFRRLGHRQALCLSDNRSGVDAQRIDGFLRAFGAADTQLMTVPMGKQARWQYYEEHLEIFQRITAIFALSDYYAADVIHFLSARGLSVPNQISVAGFDDSPVCELLSPPLTTVRQDTAERAALAIDMLHALRKGEHPAPVIVLPVTLVERGSTAPASSAMP